MSRHQRSITALSPPRICGNLSVSNLVGAYVLMSAPHTRGSIFLQAPVELPGGVRPAHAGIYLLDDPS